MESLQTTPQAKRRAPGPREWPLLGNVGAMRGLIPFLEQQWREHGDVFRVRMFGFRGVVLANPEHIQRVLIGNRHNYVKGAAYNQIRKLLGDGLVTLEGDAWRERRQLAQPAFHRQALEKLGAIMVETGAEYFDGLLERMGGQAHELDVHAEMVNVTLDVAINALFGRGVLALSQISYKALSDTLALFSNGGNGVQLPEWVPTPNNLRFQRAVRSVDANVMHIIRIARDRDEEGTLLSMLLAARDDQGEPLSEPALRNEVLTLFLAGHETTALTMTWLFVMLDGQPEVIARMRDEADSVLGQREPTVEDLPKLSYIRQVIDETLRLRPVAPMVARNAVADDQVGGFSISAGEAVVPFIWGTHRHPDHWEEPLRFDPERFAPGKQKARHTSSYIPFSVGPRICIGNAFTLMETTFLVAQILRRFDIEILPCGDVQPNAVGTVRPSRPVNVRLSARK